jgi:hypothetical protein
MLVNNQLVDDLIEYYIENYWWKLWKEKIVLINFEYRDSTCIQSKCYLYDSFDQNNSQDFQTVEEYYFRDVPFNHRGRDMYDLYSYFCFYDDVPTNPNDPVFFELGISSMEWNYLYTNIRSFYIVNPEVVYKLPLRYLFSNGDYSRNMDYHKAIIDL